MRHDFPRGEVAEKSVKPRRAEFAAARAANLRAYAERFANLAAVVGRCFEEDAFDEFSVGQPEEVFFCFVGGLLVADEFPRGEFEIFGEPIFELFGQRGEVGGREYLVFVDCVENLRRAEFLEARGGERGGEFGF